MNKELKEKLEKALETQGLDKGLLAFVNIKTEDEIQGVVDNLNKLKTPKLSVEEILKLPEVAQYADKRVGDAKKKWEEGKQEPPKPQTPPNGITAESIAAIVAEAQKPLLEKLNGFEANKVRDGKLAQAKAALKDSKIPESLQVQYLEQYNPDSETKLEEWVKSSELKHETYVQTLIDSGKLSGQPPLIIDSAELTTEELDAKLEKMAVI